MRAGGRILAAILDDVQAMAKPGVTTATLSARAKELIAEHGVEPSFLGYGGYPDVICLSVNQQAVHTPGSPYVLREGDLLKLDFGVVKDGLHTDSARSIIVSDLPVEEQKKCYKDLRVLMQATREALDAGIAQCVPGNHIGDIAAAVQKTVEDAGFTVLKELGGHGIGHVLHDEPFVPNVGKPGQGVLLQAGMTLALEPIVSFTASRTKDGPDGFTYETVDGSVAAHFEHTVLITDYGPEVLTKT